MGELDIFEDLEPTDCDQPTEYEVDLIAEQEVLQRGNNYDLTRCRYGAKILSSTSVAICDHDLPISNRGEHKAVRLKLLHMWLDECPESTIRVYETFKGFRTLIVHEPMKVDNEYLSYYRAFVGEDPLYTKLCLEQKLFAARLTAKPWRMTPMMSMNDYENRHDFIAEYDESSREFSAAKYLFTLGSTGVHNTCQDAVAVHDLIACSGRLLA